MADNYLERQRELYEARKAAWEKKKKYGVKRTPKASASTRAQASETPTPAPSTEQKE